jgi:hypothetical protein
MAEIIGTRLKLYNAHFRTRAVAHVPPFEEAGESPQTPARSCGYTARRSFRSYEEAPCFVAVLVGVEDLFRIPHSAVSAADPTPSLRRRLVSCSHSYTCPFRGDENHSISVMLLPGLVFPAVNTANASQVGCRVAPLTTRFGG